MGLSVDTRTIVRAWVVAWGARTRPCRDGGYRYSTPGATYGIAYETSDGKTSADLIGKKAQTQAIVRTSQNGGSN